MASHEVRLNLDQNGATALITDCRSKHQESCGFASLETEKWFDDGLMTQTLTCDGIICYLRAKVDPLYDLVPEEF